jgi:hypothetical protein
MKTIKERLMEIHKMDHFIGNKKEMLNKVLKGYDGIIEGRSLLDFDAGEMSGIKEHKELSYCQLQYCLKHYAKTGRFPKNKRNVPNSIDQDPLI